MPKAQSPARATYISIGCKPYEIKISTNPSPERAKYIRSN